MKNQLNLFATPFVMPEAEPGTRLLDLIGLDEGERLTITHHQTAGNTAEARLLSKISQMKTGWSLANFTTALGAWMRQTSVGNHATFSVVYVLVSSEDRLDIYHLNTQAERDRHVCTITKPTDSNHAEAPTT